MTTKKMLDATDKIRLALNSAGVITNNINIEERLLTGFYGLDRKRLFITIDGELTNSPIKNSNPIQKIVSNKKNGYTIVKFTDGTVSKVKCNNEDYDVEKAVAMAICKHLIGNHNFYKALDNALIIEKEEENNV